MLTPLTAPDVCHLSRLWVYARRNQPDPGARRNQLNLARADINPTQARPEVNPTQARAEINLTLARAHNPDLWPRASSWRLRQPLTFDLDARKQLTTTATPDLWPSARAPATPELWARAQAADNYGTSQNWAQQSLFRLACKRSGLKNPFTYHERWSWLSWPTMRWITIWTYTKP